jgi:leucyl/phenylalanyl-tRNA--protein transferase
MRLTPDLLLRAYALGVFPMAERRDDPDLHWIDPRKRGVIPLDGFHVSRRLKRTLRSGRFTFSVNRCFPKVIAACAQPRPGHPETWISPQIEGLYVELSELGAAHSVEAWEEGELAGGLYGVSLGAAFFGESMFSRRREASKAALVALVWLLQKGGFVLLDAQFQTEHLANFGCIEISRADYKTLLGQALQAQGRFPQNAPSKDDLATFLASLPT